MLSWIWGLASISKKKNQVWEEKEEGRRRGIVGREGTEEDGKVR